MRKLLGLCAAAGLMAGCRHDRPEEGSEKAKQQINGQFSAWQKSFEAKDVNGVMRMYAPGTALTAYDIVPPLQYKGANAYRRDYAEFFAQFTGPLHVQFRDQHMEVSGDLALAYGLERITGKLKSSQPADLWVRYTSAFKKIGGQWRDIHDHISVPVELNTGKAALNLTP
jgi:ketosteroid isomerase-like protein